MDVLITPRFSITGARNYLGYPYMALRAICGARVSLARFVLDCLSLSHRISNTRHLALCSR